MLIEKFNFGVVFLLFGPASIARVMGGFFSLVLGWPSKLIPRIDAAHLATAMARGGASNGEIEP